MLYVVFVCDLFIILSKYCNENCNIINKHCDFITTLLYYIAKDCNLHKPLGAIRYGKELSSYVQKKCEQQADSGGTGVL